MTTGLAVLAALAYLAIGALVAGWLRDYVELPLWQIVSIAALWPLMAACILLRLAIGKARETL